MANINRRYLLSLLLVLFIACFSGGTAWYSSALYRASQGKDLRAAGLAIGLFGASGLCLFAVIGLIVEWRRTIRETKEINERS